MALSSRQRQTAYRKRIRERGLTRLTTTIDVNTVNTLRALAREHRRTQAEVIQLGVLMAQRALSSDEGN